MFINNVREDTLMTTQTKAAMAARIAELEGQLQAKPTESTAGYAALYENDKRNSEHAPIGYMLIDVPEGVTKLRVAMWKPDRKVVNKRGQRALLTGQVTPYGQVNKPGRVDEPAVPFDDELGF